MKLIIDSAYRPRRVYGVDFSGAKKAGNKIWIAVATITDEALIIEDCYQAKNLPGSSVERDQCLDALQNFISTQKECAFGLDFPFGLPSFLVQDNTWEEFILSFSNHYPDPAAFRNICWIAAGNSERKRDTDQVNKTPFSPYNRRLYRQTYYGIRNVLAPLVQNRLVSVCPMQKGLKGNPWLLEVCPASTLKKIGLYFVPYKGANQETGASRLRILEGIKKTGFLLIQTPVLESKILGDSNGDALDSVIAAFAAFRNLVRSSCLENAKDMLEGHVYA